MALHMDWSLLSLSEFLLGKRSVGGLDCNPLRSGRHEWKSVKFKHSFCSLILLGVVAAEFYYVSLVGVKLAPQNIHSVLRTECRSSGKGGKIRTTFRDCAQG